MLQQQNKKKNREKEEARSVRTLSKKYGEGVRQLSSEGRNALANYNVGLSKLNATSASLSAALAVRALVTTGPIGALLQGGFSATTFALNAKGAVDVGRNYVQYLLNNPSVKDMKYTAVKSSLPDMILSGARHFGTGR